MNHILVDRPYPACILPITHPLRADTFSRKVDVAETFARHSRIDVRDSYERCEMIFQSGYLELPGEFA